MTSQVSYLITTKGASVSIKGTTYLFSPAYPNYDVVVQHLTAEEWDKIPDLVNIPAFVERMSNGRMRMRGDHIYFGEERLPTHYVLDKLFKMPENSDDYSALEKFIFNCLEISSSSLRQDLYLFLEKHRPPLTSDGHFLTYKRVRFDYMDCYSGTFRNRPGDIVWLKRDLCDFDRYHTCSTGLHVCSRSYLTHYEGERVVVCKVHPTDVVAVTVDHDNAKMRVCRYEVVSEETAD